MFATVPDSQNRCEQCNAFFKSLGNWVRTVADPFDLSLVRGNKQAEYAAAWANASTLYFITATKPCNLTRTG